jgi:hypothetical protein
MIEFTAYFKKQTGFITFKIPEGFQGALDMLADSVKTGQLTVKITKPRKPRSTGENSQNNHAWGHAMQLARHTGHSLHEIEFIAKVRAITKGYPVKPTLSPYGVPMVESQENIDTAECAILIDEYHMMAKEIDLELKEE